MGKGGKGGGDASPLCVKYKFSPLRQKFFYPSKKYMVSVMVYPLLIAREYAPLL